MSGLQTVLWPCAPYGSAGLWQRVGSAADDYADCLAMASSRSARIVSIFFVSSN